MREKYTVGRLLTEQQKHIRRNVYTIIFKVICINQLRKSYLINTLPILGNIN